jgi:phage shock protein A
MRIFTRLSGIITANLNALLDSAENPERMLAQVIRDMESGLVLARQQGATAIAAERRLGRELEQSRNLGRHWHEQARRALASGREDLARLALARKIEQDDLAHALEPQWAAAQSISAEVKSALHALAVRLAEARRKQRTLIARHRAAKIRLEMRRTVHVGIAGETPAFAAFARFEDKLVDAEDHLLAQSEMEGPTAEVEADLAKLELSKRVDQELTALRSTMESP